MSDPTAHAEILAIRRAAEALGDWRLAGCTLVVTLEPCAMCAAAIVEARISKVVFGAPDSDKGACGSKANLLVDLAPSPPIEVIGGISEGASRDLLKRFFHSRRDV